MWKKRISLLVVSLSISAGIFAQETYTLAGLIDQVLLENYQIKIVQNEVLLDVNNNTPGNAGFLPIVSLSGGRSATVNNTRQELFNGDVREGDNAKSTNFNGLIRADWTLFDGFGMFARSENLTLFQEQSATRSKFFIEQTIADVASLYYQLVGSKIRLTNFQNSFAVSKFRHDLEKKKLAVGSSNALLYNQAFMDYNSDSLLILEQTRVIKSLQIQLNRALNRDLGRNIQLADISIEVRPISDKQELLQDALENNLEIDLVDIEMLLAETNTKLQKSALYPQLDVFGQYSLNKSTSEIGFTELNRSNGTQVGFSIRYNLFNGGRVKSQLKNAEVIRKNTDINKADIQLAISATVLDLYSQYKSLELQLALARLNVEASEKSQFIAKQQLEKQAISGYDFRLTQLSVINAYNTATQLKLSLKLLDIELSRITGKLLTSYLN